MIVESEPAGLLMLRFKLYFNQHRPDPEDAWVLAYLQEHGLEPRREFTEEHEGVPYKILHFGQCYLGRHVEPLGQLYQRGIEYTLLAEHIGKLLAESHDTAVHAAVAPLDATTLASAATALAETLHAEARFGTTEDKTLQVVIDPPRVYETFLSWWRQQ